MINFDERSNEILRGSGLMFWARAGESGWRVEEGREFSGADENGGVRRIEKGDSWVKGKGVLSHERSGLEFEAA